MKRRVTTCLLAACLAGAFAAQTAATPKCPGDCNDDGMVGFADLVTVLRDWDRTDPCVSDIDGSGRVDFTDFTILLSKWGPCP